MSMLPTKAAEVRGSNKGMKGRRTWHWVRTNFAVISLGINLIFHGTRTIYIYVYMLAVYYLILVTSSDYYTGTCWESLQIWPYEVNYDDWQVTRKIASALNLLKKLCWSSISRCVIQQIHTSVYEVFKRYGTLPETNIAPENRPSQKETNIPTIHFLVLCWFQGG